MQSLIQHVAKRKQKHFLLVELAFSSSLPKPLVSIKVDYCACVTMLLRMRYYATAHALYHTILLRIWYYHIALVRMCKCHIILLHMYKLHLRKLIKRI